MNTVQKIKKFITVAAIGFAVLAPGMLTPVFGGVASATLRDSLCQGVDAASDNPTKKCLAASSGDASSGLTSIATTITKYFSIIVGAISIIMIIFGGFRYITSGGDSGKVGSAKNTLIYAIVGLVIVALAQLIVRVVLTQADTTTNTL